MTPLLSYAPPQKSRRWRLVRMGGRYLRRFVLPKTRAMARRAAQIACVFPLLAALAIGLAMWIYADFQAHIPPGMDEDDMGGGPKLTVLLPLGSFFLLFVGSALGLVARVLGVRRWGWAALGVNAGLPLIGLAWLSWTLMR